MNYEHMQPPGWVSRELCWVKKPIQKGYIMYNSISLTILRWKYYSHGEQINGCWELRRECAVKVRITKKGCDIVLYLYTVIYFIGETGWMS